MRSPALPALLLVLPLTALLLAADSAEDDGPYAPRAPAVLAANGRVWVVPPLDPGPPPTGAMPQRVVDIAQAVGDKPLPERIEAISAAFMGAPYAIDPLGEAQAPDTGVYARYDAFDCLTFVEEVLALSLSADPVHAADLRHWLRYGDKPAAYANRRHFMELQWLPGNIADGLLIDTSTTYGPTTPMRRDVTTTTWKTWRKRSRFAELSDDELPTGTMSLDVLSLETAAAVAQQIRPGSVVLTVRSDTGPIWTTHLGLAARGADGRMVFRNASRRRDMAVVDEDLEGYFTHLGTYTNWPVAGIAIFEPVEQSPRIGAAPPSR